MIPEQKSIHQSQLYLIGWREWISLPELGIRRIKAKIDTGAKTSALHAFSIERFRIDHRDKVRFYIHPIQASNRRVVICQAEVIDERVVTDSGGHAERRYVICTELYLGHHHQQIEITLTNRDNMRFRMLLGRSALANHYMVDVGHSYLLGKKDTYTA